MAMFFIGLIPYENWIMMMLSVPALFWSGSEFFCNCMEQTETLFSEYGYTRSTKDRYCLCV